MGAIAISISLLSLIVNVDCLQCYHCNTTFPQPESRTGLPNCVYSDLKKEINEFGNLVSCDVHNQSENENNQKNAHPLCMLVTSKTESGEFRMRSCVEGPASLSGQCIQRVEEDGSERQLCYCSTDECNATPETVSGESVTEIPIKCYECIPGDSLENEELPSCMTNSTEPGN